MGLRRGAYPLDAPAHRARRRSAPHVGAWLAHKMPLEKRGIYERMAMFGRDWNLWQAGVGDKPDMRGVIVTKERGRFRRSARHD